MFTTHRLRRLTKKKGREGIQEENDSTKEIRKQAKNKVKHIKTETKYNNIVRGKTYKYDRHIATRKLQTPPGSQLKETNRSLK